MKNQNINKKDSKYEGLEMDEIKSPPFKMIILFLGLTGLGILYVFFWVFLLSP